MHLFLVKIKTKHTFGGVDMVLQFIAGKSGSGKTTYLLEQIQKRATEKPNENQILIVPDQMSYQMERFLFEQSKLKGIMNIQIYSFSRLAWRVLQETGGLARVFLTHSGMEMLIRQVIQEEKGNLKLFGKAASKRGFYKELTNLFQEMKQYEVELPDLKQQAALAKDFATRQKLTDIALIYERYEQRLYGKYLESEDYLQLLKEKMSSSSFVKNASIYFDGFYSFSKREVSVIAGFLETANRVKITLTANQKAISGQLADFDMFDTARETLLQLRTVAEDLKVAEEPLVFLYENRRQKHPDLLHLANIWGQSKFVKYNANLEGVHFHQANNKASEIKGVAREISRLIREEGYRYSDMVVLIRNMSDYEEMISSVFDRHKLSYFWDKKRSMAKHPLIEFMRSSLDIIQLNWQYEVLFQAVKTEFFFPVQENTAKYRKKMDVFENYLLENGIFNRSRFVKSEKWTYRRIRGLETNVQVQTDDEREIEDQINEMRNLIQEPLQFLENKFQQAETGREYALALFQYMEKLQVAERLEVWRAKSEEENFLELAREHEQVWSAVIKLLDEFVDLLGDNEITKEEFIDIMQTGLESMEFSLLPPSLDQVNVTDMEHARLLTAKVVFVVGLNEGVFPQKTSNKGIISEEEREELVQADIALKPQNYKMLVEEEFIAYRAFTAPSDKLYLSYPTADMDGKLIPESSYLRKIKALFPTLEEKTYVSDLSLLSEKEQLHYIENEMETLGYLTTELQMYKQGYKISPIWLDVYNYFIKNNNKIARKVLSSLNYHNDTNKLTDTTATALFGDKIHASVSRMEKFFSCEFQHFAQYGLKLEERKVYQLQAVDMGEIFHGAMEWIVNQLKVLNIEFGKLTDQDCIELANKAMAYLAPKLHHEILLSSNRMAYIKHKLLHIVIRATSVLNEQAKKSAFQPLGLEVSFGIGKNIPAMKIPLKDHRELLLQGRIDRIDFAQIEDKNYLRIIDYKSSSRDIQLPEIYYGIALQMLTYLDVVVTNAQKIVGEKAEAAGVLYFHMHNKLLNTDGPLPDDKLTKELQKSFKMKGLILEDPLTVSLMDTTIKEGGASAIVPAEIKKDGTLSAKSKTATKDNFDSMRHFVRHKYQEAGNKILDGEVDINPYHLKDTTPCTYCPFRTVCQFDPGSQSDKYRYLTTDKSSDFIKKMKEEGSQDGKPTS